MDTHRKFKLLYQTVNGNVEMVGRYIGARPKHAACKAMNEIYKIYKNEETIFGIKETTKNSDNKMYWYVGKQENINEPLNLYKLNGIFYSKNKINEFGGFEKIFGKKEDEVKPNIISSHKISVRRANKNEYSQLYENVVKSCIINEPIELHNDYIFDEKELISGFSLISNYDAENENEYDIL
jgi:hypothetical protein